MAYLNGGASKQKSVSSTFFILFSFRSASMGSYMPPFDRGTRTVAVHNFKLYH